MHKHGELNVGQLVRERYGNRARLIGGSTYHGTVPAAACWDGPTECKQVLPALPGCVEALLHEALRANFLLPLSGDSALADALAQPCLERAIGVLYLPATERQSHYFSARLPSQFDALLHMDCSSAVTPFETMALPGAESPETFPAGL